MMSERIESKLLKAFQPSYLTVENESHRHNVPVGSETHFKVVIVSDHFTGTRLLQRHRQIYQLLTEEMASKVHAIALHTYTKKEWEYLNATPPVSPPCYGGGVSH